MDTDDQSPIETTYRETETERLLIASRGDATVTIAQPRSGYGMVIVRDAAGRELERYYGLEMALDHAADHLGIEPGAIEVPEAAAEMGM